MELLTKLEFEKSNQAKRDQSKHCNQKVFENLKRKVIKANESGLNSALKAQNDEKLFICNLNSQKIA